MIKKLSGNEDGVAHLLLIIVAVVVVAAIGFVGYRVASHKSTPSSSSDTSSNSSSTTSSNQSSASTSTAYSSCLASFHDTNLCHFEENSLDFDKTAYTATLTETSTQGAVSDMTLASDGKGNTSLSVTSNGEKFSTISLSGNTYIQSGTGTTWVEYPAGTAGASSESTNPTSDMSIGVGDSGITYKAEGTTSCGSLTCYKYEVTDSSQPGTTQYAWFDTSSYKLREWQSTDSTNGTIVMNISYQGVNITAPSPVEQYGQAL